MKPNGDRTVQGRGNQLSRKMSKSGQDDFVTLGAAALLTGLLIFVAGREQKHDESSKDCDLDALAASHARIPADEPIAVQKARAAQPGRGRAARGAKLNAEIEHQTAEDTTIGPPKPLGSRGAVMADTVGRAVV